MINVTQKGDWSRTFSFLGNKQKRKEIIQNLLEIAGEAGVRYLESATPKLTGLLSRSWRYKIIENDGETILEWHNDDIENGLNVAILVQYGHATARGKYVQGFDFINPVIDEVYKNLITQMWKEVVEDA